MFMKRFDLFCNYEKLKYKYILKKYPESNNIFGPENHALTYLECDLSSDYHKRLLKEYNNHCKPIIQIYNDFILGLVTLINTLIDNPSTEEMMYIFGYLYYNGYLSIKNQFKFTIPECEFPAQKALSIFTGEGVCRNIGSMFVDILKESNIHSFGIITDHDTYDSEPVYLSEKYEEMVTRDEEEFVEFFEQNIKEKIINTGTHFEVVSFDTSLKVIDPTELCVYELSKKENEYPSLNYLRLWSTYSMGTHNIKQTIQLYNLFKKRYLHLHKGEKNLNIQERCFDICEKNKTKLLKFHKRYSKHIELLNESMQDLKKVN